MHHVSGGECHCEPKKTEKTHDDGSVCHCDDASDKNDDDDESHHHSHHEQLSVTARIKPYTVLIITLVVVILFALGATLLSGYQQFHVFMQYLMAGYFLAFGGLQTISLRKSARMLQQYDPLAKRIPAYGYLYPLIQLALGAAYLFWFSPIITNIVAVIVLFINTRGVAEVLAERRSVRCGCLGSALNVRVGWVTLIENLIMFTMAAGMLIYFMSTYTPADTPAEQRPNTGHQHQSL